MKRIGALMLIGLLLIVCGAVIPASAMTGSGTQANPYILTTQADLSLLSGSGYASYTGNDKYFELGADITMSGTFTPIGTSSYKFNGHFDGKGHRITGLKTSSNPSGLFMYVTSGAEMKNINFYNAQITGTGGDGTGVLYGRCYQATNLVTVSNVNVYDSKVTASSIFTGGIFGVSITSSNVMCTSCNVKGCVISSSAAYVGGIVGGAAYQNSQGTYISCNVEDCILSGSGYGSVGGIAGQGGINNCKADYNLCHVKNCYLFVNQQSSEGWCGGITADICDPTTYASIIGCTVEKCTIRTSRNNAGGILGGARGNPVTISDCAVTDCTIIAAGSYAAGICSSA